MTTPYILHTGTEDQVTLAVQMMRRYDRFEVELQYRRHHASSTLVLRSVEGDELQFWPPSPAIQQVSRQKTGSEAFLAGVGMAGNAHWSMSMAVIDGTLPTLEFDVACRVKSEPAWLGSTYTILKGRSSPSWLAGARIAMGDDVLLRVEPAADVGICNVVIDQNQLRVVPRRLGGPLPRTVRWKYRISVVGKSG